MPRGSTIAISVVGDTRELGRNMAEAEQKIKGVGDTAQQQGSRIDSAFDSTAEHADTVASKGAQAAGALSGLGDLIGGKFGAAMQAGGVAMQAAADAGDLLNVVTDSSIVRKAKDIAVTTGQKAAMVASTAATWTMNAATKALNLTMRANPIGLVITLILALVAGIVLAYKKSETFRKIVDKAFAAVKKVVGAVANFITKKVPKAFEWIKDKAAAAGRWIAGRFQALADWFKSLPGRITRKAGDVFHSLRDKARAAKDWVTGKFGDLVGWFRGLPGRIGSGLRNLVSKFTSPFRGAFNAIKRLWNAIDFGIHFNISIPSWVPGIGGSSFGINIDDVVPDVALATGGIVTRPTTALIGEAGPEAVIPLSRAGVLGNTYNITVVAPVGSSSADIGRELTKHIDAYERAGGRRRA